MAINPKIRDKAEKIRKEVYGKDVREALASGLEVMSEDVEETKQRQNNVESQFQSVLDETTGKDVISAPEVIAARVGADGTQYSNLKQRLDSEHNKITAQLAKIDKKTLGIPLAKLPNVTITDNYTGVLPIAYKDGWLYGFENNRTIVRSKNDGDTWEKVADSPAGSLHSIHWTNDGEVLLGFNDRIIKSVGWSKNPNTATWKTVVTKSNPKGVGILPWGIDGDGTKFIVTEYSGEDRSESRYVWISTDMGETFNVVVDKFEIDPTNSSHMHGVCYDRWADRFFVSHGHGVIKGVYWSDDDGASWHKVKADFEFDAAPTTLTATDNGIVAGSDSGSAGLYGIQRTENPHDMVMRRTARWVVPREGVPGFAYRSVRDEETGQVYVAFKPDFRDVKPVIMAGTATTGSTLWEGTEGSVSIIQFLTVTKKKVIAVRGVSGSYELIESDKPVTGVNNFDDGNILTGKATSTSIGIGRNVDVKTRDEIVIGNNAKQENGSGTENVIIGHNAKGGSQGVTIGSNSESKGGFTVAVGKESVAGGQESIAVGYKASTENEGTKSVAIGADSKSLQPGAIAIGAGSNAHGDSSTAIGRGASAGFQSLAIGYGASAGNASQVAIGHNAKSIYANSVALGSNTSTTTNNQVQIGDKHIEMSVSATVGSVPSDKARIFFRQNPETNKYELCVRIGDVTTVLASGR